MNTTTTTTEDDKHVKYSQQQTQKATNNNGYIYRKIAFYILLITFFTDCIVSKGETMMHLTLWSYALHTLYFELSIEQSTTLTKILHGPSYSGSHALFAMYLFTLYANPNMEFDLAPPDRPAWVVYIRAFWFHFGPVLLHYIDMYYNKRILCNILYNDKNMGKVLQFWTIIGGYFAMGLTWEQINGDASGTYKIEKMSHETYVNINKLIGIFACILCYIFGTRPLLNKK